MNQFSHSLLNWYRDHKRDLPWRNGNSAYRTWLSEIILQQTRVHQGLNYYSHFVEQYSNVVALADAPLEDVLKLWQGLGYYSRARNMHKAAQMVAYEMGGVFPETYKQLVLLPGVGPYTAAAIASIIFGEVVPAVDGNVKRVISRFFYLKGSIDNVNVTKDINALVSELISTASPGDFNQAMMDLGAMVCKPKKPICDKCPLEYGCMARAHNVQEQLPVRKAKVPKRTRYFYYFVFLYQRKTWLQKRTEKDIWEGLYEFPLVESDCELSFDDLCKQVDKLWGINMSFEKDIQINNLVKHVLTHQIIMAQFIVFSVKKQFLDKPLLVDLSNVKNYAVSRLIEKYLNMDENFL